MLLHSDPGWVQLWGSDPRPWLLASGNAVARFLAIDALDAGDGLDVQRRDPPDAIDAGSEANEAAPASIAASRREDARVAALASDDIQRLLGSLATWTEPMPAGHDRPGYLPNQLSWLADLGVRGGDDDRVEEALDALAVHQDDNGRFLAYGSAPGMAGPLWHSMPCDTHLVVDVLVRYGRAGHPATKRGLGRIAADLCDTPVGPCWTCRPDPQVGWRGPGRRGDLCPQVSLEAVRAWSRLPADEQPDNLVEVAASLVRVWLARETSRPYAFGHGIGFKTVKWPPLWYGILAVLDTLGRVPQVWASSGPLRRGVAELVACLLAYNVGEDGAVTPRSVYRGFTGCCYGQKRTASPIATARLAAVVVPFSSLAEEVAAVDVHRLASAKGGTGTPRPPRG